MIVSKRPEVERLLKAPDADLRAVVIHGRDRAMVRERADALAGKLAPAARRSLRRPNCSATARLRSLEDALSALSMTGGRRLVRLRLGDKAGPDKAAAEALTRHLAGDFNPDAFLLIEAGALGRESALRKAAEKAPPAAPSSPATTMSRATWRAWPARPWPAIGWGSTPRPWSCSWPACPDRGVARQEIERLALWLGPGSGRIATAGDLSDFLGVEPEASLAEAAIDAFGARLGAAQAALRRAAAEGEGGPAAVRAMGYHLGRLRRVLTCASQRRRPAGGGQGGRRVLEAGARVPAPGPGLEPGSDPGDPGRDPDRRSRLQDLWLARPADLRAFGVDDRRPRAAVGALGSKHSKTGRLRACGRLSRKRYPRRVCGGNRCEPPSSHENGASRSTVRRRSARDRGDFALSLRVQKIAHPHAFRCV
jgi:DNA polymerase-3 subunit delta